MGRPRSQLVKLVLDLPEKSYQVLGAMALPQGESVSEYVRKLIDEKVACSVPLPLFQAVGVVPEVQAPPAAVPAAEGQAASEALGGFGPRGDLDKYGKRKRG